VRLEAGQDERVKVGQAVIKYETIRNKLLGRETEGIKAIIREDWIEEGG
jgi:hypothetical protein